MLPLAAALAAALAPPAQAQAQAAAQTQAQAQAQVPAQTQAPAEAPAPPTPRPRIGLVLSGGGARGLAHVGVLKVLEELQIPIDVITGTSMGAIVGGLYASGMRAADLDRALRAVNWGEVFTNRVQRQQLSQRRKEEDFEIAAAIELGLRDGELLLPSGAVSSRGLESLLRRYTLPVRGVARFDDLPIRFRAVATDMETGAAVVLDSGDLALALRASMSVPGAFAPTEVDGRVLGDGGLVNNLPIDVARAGRRNRHRRQHRHPAGRTRHAQLGGGADGADDQPADRAKRAAQPGHAAAAGRADRARPGPAERRRF